MKLNKQPLKQTIPQSSMEPSSNPALLKAVLEQMPVAICTLDIDLRIASFNSAATSLIGFTNKDVGRYFESFLTAPINGFERHVQATKTKEKIQTGGGETIATECNVLTQEGKELPVNLTISPFFLDGKIAGYTALLQHVSLKQQLHTDNIKVKEDLPFLPNPISNLSDAIFIADKNYVLIFWSTGAEKMFSVEESNAMHKNVWDLLLPNTLPEEVNGLTNLLETSGKLEKDFTRTLADGTTATYKLSATKLLDTDAGFNGFLGLCHDITLLKESGQNTSLSQKISENELFLYYLDQHLHYHLNNTSLAAIEWQGLQVTKWSKRAEEIFGWTAEEAIGKSAEDLNMVFENDEEVLKVRSQVFESQTTFERSINRNRTKTGTPIFCEWYSSVLRKSNGEVSSVLTFVQDITERVNAERKLAEREKQLELIYGTVTDVLFMLDITPQGYQFASVNYSFLQTTGLTWEQVVGQHVHDVIPQPSLNLVLENYQKAVEQKTTIQWEEETVYPSGVKTGIVTITPVLDSTGACTQLVGSVHDITDRKRAELELAESENRLKTILDTDPECIKLIGFDGKILQMNPAGLAIIEADELDEVIGKQMTYVISNSHRKSFIDLTNNVLKGATGELVFEITGLKGTKRWLQTHAVPLRDARNNIIAALAVTRDITIQKKKAEEVKDLNIQLRQLTEHLEQIREEERISIAREIHDELGQLLTAIKLDLFWSKSNLQKNKEAVADKLEESLLLIDDTIDTIRRIVSELHPVLLQDLGLVEALRWHIHQFRIKSNIDVSFETNMEEVNLPNKISLALFRICQEALTNVQRHAQATKVSISLFRENDHYRLRISDNGIGFDKLKEKNKRSFGLLGISERTLMCAGELDIDSTPGKGTTILITLPIIPGLYE